MFEHRVLCSNIKLYVQTHFRMSSPGLCTNYPVRTEVKGHSLFQWRHSFYSKRSLRHELFPGHGLDKRIIMLHESLPKHKSGSLCGLFCFPAVSYFCVCCCHFTCVVRVSSKDIWPGLRCLVM